MNDSIRTHVKTVRLKDDLIATIQEQANNENRTFSNMVETLLLEIVSKK